MSPTAEGVIRRLDAARQKWWLCTLLSTSVLAVCASFGLLLVFMCFDALIKCPQGVLIAMFAAWLGVTAALIVLVGRRLLRSQRSLEATARRVEWEMPELGSDLINLVQLAEDTRNEQRAFCEAAVTQAAGRIGRAPFDQVAHREPRWRRFVHCMQMPRDLAESLGALALLIAMSLFCRAVVPNWGSAAGRLLTPWEFVPSIGSVGTIEVTPGDTEVLVGSSLEIAAKIKNPQSQPYQATLLVAADGEPETEMPILADQEFRQFRVTLPAVLKPLRYRIEVGDSQTSVYRVAALEKATIVDVQVTYHYPAYMRRKTETFTQKTADLEAPQYTKAELQVRSSVPLSGGDVRVAGGQPLRGTVQEDRSLLVVPKMILDKDTTFTIQLANQSRHVDPDPRVNRVRVLPDKPPIVELLKPPRQCTAAPGGEVPVIVRANDDYGIGRMRLEMKVQQATDHGQDARGTQSSGGTGVSPVDEGHGQDARGTEESESEHGQDARATDSRQDAPATVADGQSPITEVTQWDDIEAGTTVVRHYKLPLGEKLQPGQTVLLRAVAWDNRRVPDAGIDLKPQQTAGAWHAVRLVAAETQSQAALAQLDSLRAAIWKILEKQIAARIRAAKILKADALAERRELAGGVRNDQIEVQKASDELAKSIGASDGEERLAIKRTLGKLCFGEMLDAVRRCDELMKLASPDAFAQPLPEVLATQNRIIEVLRKILDATRQAQDEALAEMKKRLSGDLPDDTRKKLEDARNKLEEFLKQQKKVIEASENLAKKPVEDFTEEDEQKLKEMAASQDDWAKFMTELKSDLSKLPEQDFANASLAKELVEIQTELKMAEDALTKKTADIAVPLEQLGYERAEDLKTNLEKWLPDTPDRERWSQEESLTDQDKEAPMAELPGELEDLVGELMEEEEDLFDEMEDISSSAMDSLDKGAGWDAVDGPISNNSAKGVTGNRLPNTSEIAGRSGEGRSGKSSGEFVGDEAVGKGGRKTPSRLTPDPYVKGQIKDHSKDPTGGATGGGKESGQGGKGLEGPQPNAPGPRDLDRLAGKQAALRNKAEGVDLQLQVSNFHHTDLKKMIELMEQVERDLRSGRYQNALRERKVLVDGLGNVKQYLDGEFQVRQDVTANLPTDIQKEILGSMHDPSPQGWEELNRQYFERLSTGGK